MAKKKIAAPRWEFTLRRRWLSAYGSWPFQWGFFTDWWGFSVNFGKSKEIIKGRMRSYRIVFSCSVKPFSILIFWYGKRILWIGDWKWKKDLWWKKDS